MGIKTPSNIKESMTDYLLNGLENQPCFHQVPQTKWLKKEDGALIEMDYYLRLDNLQGDLDNMLSELKMESIHLGVENSAKVNITPEINKDILYSHIDGDLLKKINERYKEDIDFFNIIKK